MSDEDLQKVIKGIIPILEDTVAVAIEKNVNGKINRLTQMMTDHNDAHEKAMAKIEPLMQSYIGVKFFGRVGAWLAGIVLGYAAYKGLTK